MKANTLPKFKARKKTVGRGIGSGIGKTCGRGTKGQKARTGKKIRAGFEGGQTPIFQRLPKYRGFRNINRVPFQVVNVSDLENMKEKVITPEVLKAQGLIARKDHPIKILGDGTLTKSLTVSASAASKSAIEKITKAGGTFEAILKPQA